MSTVDATTIPRPPRSASSLRPGAGASRLRAFTTLARRRFALSAHAPREVLVPLLTPVLFSIVIAPALATIVGSPAGGIDYMTYVSIGTVGLLVPISCMFAGIGVLVDRETGARRDLLAAPIPRSLVVAGNLAVALTTAGLQIAVLFIAATLRGAEFHTSAAGVGWFVSSAVLFAVAMYGGAETLANRVPSQEEYVGAVPAIAIVPWFFAGSLFPISALPAGLTAFAKVLPLTHALAVMRYGMLGGDAAGLRDIWGMTNATVMASLSLAVVTAYAIALTLVAVRVFTRAAVR
ncbi:MAG TPA: ABC transporter permease [Actinomycetota bacterium]